METYSGPELQNGAAPPGVARRNRISLCTVCRDRLGSLTACLPLNVDDNADYPDLEFVILDYNSRREDVGGWIMSRFPKEIESGRIVYYRTDEPEFHSMTHSRNLAFKAATGTIVNNVDADNFTGRGFATHLNALANECPTRAVFAKALKGSNGRIGFLKAEFVDILGGYDEDLTGYGHEDVDILSRAIALGFTAKCFGERFAARIETPLAAKGMNMTNADIFATERANRERSTANIAAGRLTANAGRPWGGGILWKNRKEIVEI